MQLDKKDLPKLAVLGLLVILTVGIVSFQFMRPGAVPPDPAATTKKAADAKTRGGSAAGTDSTTTASGAVISTESGAAAAEGTPGLDSSPVRRDPFVPQIVDPKDIKSSQAPQPRRATSRATTGQALQLPTGKVPPWNPISGDTSAAPTGLNTLTAVPKDPQFTLTGVIRGNQNVAIIRTGEKGRYVVKQGQIIEGRYKVLSVSDDTAVLADQNRRISVRLGGAKNGS